MSDDIPEQIKNRTPYEHFREADHYLASAKSRFEQADTIAAEYGIIGYPADGEDPAPFARREHGRTLERLADRDLMFAQVHATLATVQRALA